MDAQKFLAAFGHIANAPGGVARLRELILELAIRGELLAPSDTATNARTLLAEADVFRAEQVRSGKLRRPTPQPEIENSELPFKLPENWAFERLGNVCEIVRGVTFPASKKQTNRSTGTVACLRTSNVQAEINWDDLIFIDSDFVGREDQWVAKGDTMISMANSYELVGKVALVREVKERATFGGFIAAVRPHILEPEYLYLVLRSPYMQARMRVTASQTTNIANISLGGMRPIPTPIPPKQEQARIVAKVDELMALCDKLETQQQARRALQNKLRQSTLQALASSQSPHELQTTWARLADNFGRLFDAPEDVDALRKLFAELAIRGALDALSEPEDTTVVESYLAELAARKSGKRFAKINHGDEDIALPNGWRWVLLEDLLADSESGWSPKCDPEPRRGGEWGVLKVSAVTWGVFNPEKNKRLPQSLEAKTECEVKPGDFMLSRANTAELVARSVIAPDDCPEKLLMSDKIVRLIFLDENLKPWVNLVNNSELARSYYKAKATGTSDSMRNVSRQVIHELPVPLPSLDVQKRVLRTLDRLMSLCDALERKASSRKKLSAQLSISAVNNLTGITIDQKEEPMKAPQTELIAPLRLGTPPSVKAQAPLATILARHNGEMSAKDVWQRFGGEIDAFYAQLKTEVAQGWVVEPGVAEVRTVAA
jgi:type I restriction enzyme S subunit